MTVSPTSVVDAELAQDGFARRKRTWTRRRANGFVDVVNVQTAKSGGSVTVNLGVLDPSIYAIVWSSAAPEHVDEANCTVRTRIGFLIGPYDVWWDPNDRHSADAMTAAIRDHAPAFFVSIDSPESMLRHLQKQDVENKMYPLLVNAALRVSQFNEERHDDERPVASPRAARLREREDEPPAWLTTAIGMRPGRSKSSSGVVLAWRRAALVIDDYRRAYCHDSPIDAIGPTPIEPGARCLHQRSERAITEVADERLRRSRGMGRGD